MSSSTQPLIDEDFLLPISKGNQTKKRRINGFRNQYSENASPPRRSRGGSFGFLMMHYIVWPLVRHLLGRLGQLFILALILKFFLGVDFVFMWRIATWVWNVASSNTMANQ